MSETDTGQSQSQAEDDVMDIIESEPGAGAGAGGDREPEIGEPDKNIDPNESVCYTCNWFIRTEIEGIPHAICRTCQHEEESAVRAKKPRRKKQSVLKTTGGSTKGIYIYLVLSRFNSLFALQDYSLTCHHIMRRAIRS